MKINNPSSFERQMRRAVDAHLNRLLQVFFVNFLFNFVKFQPEQPVNLIQSEWICVFCQNGNCDEQLGELYGPYFASSLCFTTSFPTFLLIDSKIKKKIFKNKPSIDLWMHGDCAFWASGLQLIAGHFLSIEQFLSIYWTQVISLKLFKIKIKKIKKPNILLFI